MKFDDVRESDNRLDIKSGKGDKDRTTILSPNILTDYEKYKQVRDNDTNRFIFTNDRGSHMSRQAVWQIVKKYSKNIKGRIYPHAVRASFATNLRRNGVQGEHIQELMGHESFETTRGYIQVADSELRKIKSPF